VSRDRDNLAVAKALSLFTGADLEHLELSAMGQADAEALASWKYPGIYSFYDFSADPDDQAELLDPSRRQNTYFSVRVPDFGLIGFAELKPQERGALEIGLGLHPGCTGRGIGAEFVGRVCDWASERMTPALLVLRVATFNARAIRVYERAGFQPTGVEVTNSYGTDVEFLRMERSPA
jgi:ribosomal-protein-alanine N-acetyltransferase